MDFDQAIRILNGLLADKNPATFSSSWILKHAPRCYRFILKNIRTELGYIDWDTVTYALNKKFQRRWAPGRRDDPIAFGSERCKIENIFKDSVTNEIRIYKRTDHGISGFCS